MSEESAFAFRWFLDKTSRPPRCALCPPRVPDPDIRFLRDTEEFLLFLLIPNAWHANFPQISTVSLPARNAPERENDSTFSAPSSLTTQFNNFHNNVTGSDFGVTSGVQDPRTFELGGKVVF